MDHDWRLIAAEWIKTYPSKVFSHIQLKQKYTYNASARISSTSSSQMSQSQSLVQSTILFPIVTTYTNGDEANIISDQNDSYDHTR